MGSFHLNIGARGPISELFAGMPAGLKGFMREGFASLAKIPQSKRDELMQVILDSIDSGTVGTEREAQTKLGVSADDSRALLTAAGLIASTLSRRDDSPEALVQELEKAGALDAVDRPAVLRFASDVVAERSTVKQAVERSQLAGSVMPSLMLFESAVDVRLSFDKNRVAFSVPVLMVHIDTDAEGQEMWLQLSRRQVQRVIEDLQEALKQMSSADAWLNKSSKAGF
jgi:hypothetical protein